MAKNTTIKNGLYTLEEIEARFELPKEEWKPSYGKPYYTIHNLKSLRTIWYGDRDDKKRLKYGLVFESRERCVQVLRGMKAAIENIK